MASSITSSSRGASTTFTETGTVSVSGKPVGLNWVGGRGEHLLFTSPSQVILYSVQDGSRLREWSFRPTKALAFSSAVRAASAQGLLVGVQGRHKLVAWPDKGSLALTAGGGGGAAGAGPEGMKSVEVDFPVSRLEVSSVGVVWCIGQEGEKVHVACYSTGGKTALTLLASSSAAAAASSSSSSSSSSSVSVSSSLVHPSKRLLLLLLTDGTLHLYRCPDTAAAASSSSSTSSKKNQQQTPAPAAQPLTVTNLPPSSSSSSLHASGMMWSGMGQDTAYLWTVWGGGEGGREGGLFLHMARVAIGREGGREGGAARLSLIQLYTKTLVDPAAAAAAAAAAASSSSSSSSASKRRRSSTSSSLPSSSSLPPSIQTVGMQAHGLIITAVEEGGREGGREGGVRLQAWDAEHGVVVGEAYPSSSSLSLPSSSSSSSLLVGGEGVIASSSSSSPSSLPSSSSDQVVVWRVESKEGGGGEGTGLRRALGKLSAAATAAATAAAARTAAAAAPLVRMTFKSSEVGWVCQEGEAAAAATATAAAAAAAAGGSRTAEAVEELLQLLLASEQQQQQQQQNGGGKKEKRKEEERNGSSSSSSSSKKRKRVKLTGDVLLARTPIAAATALHVASLCLNEGGEEDEEGKEGGKGTAKGKTQQRRKSSEARREGGREERQAALWRLLQALIEAGKFPLREHPSILLQLLRRNKKEVVAAALAGPGDLSERMVVQALHALLRSSPSSLPPSSSSDEQQQQQQQKINKGVYAREVSKLVGLAVCRPCCPAFLRAALSEGMDGPTAALLLVLLRSLLEKTMNGKTGGGEGGREEECVLTWLEALLDAKFVSLVVQGGREGGRGGKEGGMVKKVLVGVRECARRGAMACEALELVEGYFAQFKRAGQSLQVIPDYSLESIRI